MKDKFVVTGTGRCGTQYVASVLTICGVKCGHQGVDYSKREIDFKGYEGDSSFFAANQIRYLSSKFKIIGLYRNPLKVVRSMLELGQLQNFMGFSYDSDGISRACCYYIEVNEKILSFAHSVYNIDNVNLKGIFKDIGYENKYNDNLANSIPTDCNSQNNQKKRTLELIDTDIDPYCVHLYKKMKAREYTSHFKKI